ncbi:MAG: hypothetical protein ACP5G1_04920, partial [Nanopusillaceae archaeon]
MAKKEIIDLETKRFRKEFFEWIKNEGVKGGYIREDWKGELVDYIYERKQQEGEIVKKESIRRNINRMLAYYYEQGEQVRSERKYWRYIEEWYKEKVVNEWETRKAYNPNTQRIARFQRLEHARDYAKNINALHIVP